MEPSKIQTRIDAFKADLQKSVDAVQKARNEVATLQTRIAQLEGAIYALSELEQPAPGTPPDSKE